LETRRCVGLWITGGFFRVAGDVGGGVVEPPSKLHFNEQEAGALLWPIVLSLRELEGRAGRYGHVAALSEADAAAVTGAHAALAAARAEVERLVDGVRGGAGW